MSTAMASTAMNILVNEQLKLAVSEPPVELLFAAILSIRDNTKRLYERNAMKSYAKHEME